MKSRRESEGSSGNATLKKKEEEEKKKKCHEKPQRGRARKHDWVFALGNPL
jgi:hypothetical protein